MKWGGGDKVRVRAGCGGVVRVRARYKGGVRVRASCQGGAVLEIYGSGSDWGWGSNQSGMVEVRA